MTPFEQELAHLDATLAHAETANISDLLAAIAGASESSIIAVGSGGSFTVASLLCSLSWLGSNIPAVRWIQAAKVGWELTSWDSE